MVSRLSKGLAVVALAATCGGCGVSGKRPLVAEALDQPDDRREDFEAVLLVLDNHPEYVDEFFQQARSHEATLDRFIMNAANHLDDEKLAKMTAKHLANHPPGLRKILIESLKAAKDKPDARMAIAGAIGDEDELATDIMTDDPKVVREALLGTVRHVAKKPEARKAFVEAMYASSPAIAAILAGNPNLLTKMFEEIASELSDDPEMVKSLLGKLGEDAASNDEDKADEKQPTGGE